MTHNLGDEGTVLGLDNVALELPVAGAGTRALAAFLDYLVVLALFLLLLFTAGALAMFARLRGGWIIALVLVGYFLIEYGYFAAVEIGSGGSSFGKWALGLHVVTRHGGRPGPAALLVRNAVRSVDLLVGVPLMALDPLARRLGDRLAGTLVTHASRRRDELLLRRLPRNWSAADVALLESFLRRRQELEGWRAERLARDLLAAIRRDDPALLEGLPADGDPVETLRQAVEAEGP